MRLRSVIFSVYVGSSAIGFAVLMAVMLWEVRPRYVESMQRTMGETAGLLAVMLKARIEAAPQEHRPVSELWKRELAALQSAAGRLRVYVTDQSGQVLADSDGGRDVGRNYAGRRELRGYFPSDTYAPPEPEVVEGELRVSAPVEMGGRVVAIVGVGRSLSTLQQVILGARLRLLVEALAIAATMVAVGWWLASRVAQSIERLTEYVRKVREYPRTRPPAHSRALEIRDLAQSFEDLRVALEGKAYVERYTQSLAHELKSPIAAIRGAAELLAENPPAEDRERFLANLRQESARLQQIVERLLELAAVEARTASLDTERLGLADLLAEAADRVRSAGLAEGRTLTLTAKTRPVVDGERFLLRQAVDNLIRNALEFSPEAGRVVVSLETVDGEAVIAVEDEGSGVPDFALGRVFDRFYSLPRPATGRKGTGLGLSFVREVARLHGGEATLANRAAGGARAELRLPLA